MTCCWKARTEETAKDECRLLLRCTISPYRNLVSDFGEKRWMLEKRNEIVARIYELAAGIILRCYESRDGHSLPSFLQRRAPGEFSESLSTRENNDGILPGDDLLLLRELINAKVGNQLREKTRSSRTVLPAYGWTAWRKRKGFPDPV